MKNTEFLGKDRVSTLLWEFSVPAVAGMVVSALYNVVDGVFVGQGVGTAALAAVSIVFPIMIVLMAVGMLIGLGAGTLVSISLGEGKRDYAEAILGNALTLIVIFVLATVGAALWFLEPILVNVFGVTAEVLPYARDFASIVIGGSLFLHVGFGLNNVIRAQGDPKTAFMTQAIAGLMNIVFNYILIFVFHFGIKGAASATIMAEAIAAIWVLAYFTQGRGALRFHVRNFVPRWEIVKGILSIGVAPFLLQLGASAVMVVLNWNVMKFGGDLGVAAFGIVNRIMMLVMMPIIGISQGAQPIIGYNYGSQQYERVIETLGRTLFAATALCVVSFIGLEIWAERIVLLFNDDAGLVKMGAQGIRAFLLLLPFIGIGLVGANYFQAIGKVLYSIVFSLLRQVILLIPLVYILSHYYGLMGIWAAGPVSDGLSCLLTVACMIASVRSFRRNGDGSAAMERASLR